MSVLTIRNVDDAVKVALKERAKQEGVSQAQVARRALADGLGVKVKKRDLDGLVEEIFGEDGARELSKIDWNEPAFTDEELDEMEKEKEQRIAEGANKPAGKFAKHKKP